MKECKNRSKDLDKGVRITGNDAKKEHRKEKERNQKKRQKS